MADSIAPERKKLGLGFVLTILVLATFFVLMNFLVDLAQPFLDPRITRE